MKAWTQTEVQQKHQLQWAHEVPGKTMDTVDPRLSEQQWPEDSKNHADK